MVIGLNLKDFRLIINSGRIKPDVFLCVRYDRFSRTAEETLKMLSWLKEKNIHFETLEQNYDLSIPENYLPFIVQVALPQIENERRGLNTKSGMRQAVNKGDSLGKHLLDT